MLGVPGLSCYEYKTRNSWKFKTAAVKRNSVILQFGETVFHCILQDRSCNMYTNYKGIKNNANSGQITGIQVKLDTTCK